MYSSARYTGYGNTAKICQYSVLYVLYYIKYYTERYWAGPGSHLFTVTPHQGLISSARFSAAPDSRTNAMDASLMTMDATPTTTCTP